MGKLAVRWHGAGFLSQCQGFFSSRAGLSLQATLRSRIATVRYGQSIELICQVSANYTFKEVPVSVGWLFQPSPSTGHYHKVVRVLPSGTMVWGAAQPHFQGKAQLTKDATSFRLRIHNTVAANEGTYQCEVEVWRRNTLDLGQPAATTRSNAVGIKVVLPGKQHYGCFASSAEISPSAALNPSNMPGATRTTDGWGVPSEVTSQGCMRQCRLSCFFLSTQSSRQHS